MKDNVNIVFRNGRPYIRVWFSRRGALMKPCKNLHEAIHAAASWYKYHAQEYNEYEALQYWESVGAFLDDEDGVSIVPIPSIFDLVVAR